MDVQILVSTIAVLCGIVALFFSGQLSAGIMRLPAGNARMQEIAGAIQEGATAYLTRQTKTLSIVGVVIFFVIWFTLDKGGFPFAGVSFLLGAIFSTLAGIIGMNISVRANVRTAAAAEHGLDKAFDVSFKGGCVTGLTVVALGLLGMGGLYLVYHAMGLDIKGYLHAIVGFGFGGSLLSLFTRVGGGIYTKAADVGGDLVGKVVAGLPEDDPRNPACIADNVGDNVGDCAGMGADLFETYAVTIIAAMLLGSIAFANQPALLPTVVFYPLALGAAALVSTIVATFFVKITDSKAENIMAALYKGTLSAVVISAIAFAAITRYFSPPTGRAYMWRHWSV